MSLDNENYVRYRIASALSFTADNLAKYGISESLCTLQGVYDSIVNMDGDIIQLPYLDVLSITLQPLRITCKVRALELSNEIAEELELEERIHLTDLGPH